MYLLETKLSTLPVSRGSASKGDATKIQDWLRLNDFTLDSDGDFGPGTESAVKAYQTKNSMAATGVVDAVTWNSLCAPLYTALSYKPGANSFGEAVVQIAKDHLRLNAKELDANRGPWVRTYCKGPDGSQWAWCQGFASTIWEQASETRGVPSPIDLDIYDEATGRKLWCLFVPTMVNQAKKQKKFVSGQAAAMNPLTVVPGSQFFVRGGQYGYTHVGIVVSMRNDGSFTTIEGNTNSGGSANGDGVYARTRSIASCDFGLAL